MDDPSEGGLATYSIVAVKPGASAAISLASGSTEKREASNAADSVKSLEPYNSDGHVKGSSSVVKQGLEGYESHCQDKNEKSAATAKTENGKTEDLGSTTETPPTTARYAAADEASDQPCPRDPEERIPQPMTLSAEDQFTDIMPMPMPAAPPPPREAEPGAYLGAPGEDAEVLEKVRFSRVGRVNGAAAPMRHHEQSHSNSILRSVAAAFQGPCAGSNQHL